MKYYSFFEAALGYNSLAICDHTIDIIPPSNFKSPNESNPKALYIMYFPLYFAKFYWNENLLIVFITRT